MKRRLLGILIALAATSAAVICLVLAQYGAFVREVWTRDNPLAHASQVASVQNGTIRLGDGRAFRPAGVRRLDGVAPEEYDRALRAIVAQGVVVIRDFGDGRVFLMAEPKFYNWCGTHGVWYHWAGAYIQCPVSELLIYSGYARANLDDAGMTPHERWRLEGVGEIGGNVDGPVSISATSAALRFDATVRSFSDYDANLEMMWKPPPPP